jgi:ABC-type dipeptide/oligopeptide/nickel transport system permease subunit
MRVAAGILLAAIALLALPAEWTAPKPYEEQFRDAVEAGPSREFPLGTDALGRDRWSRLIYGTRLSLTLSATAAALCVALAAIIGATAGYFGGRIERGLLLFIDLFLTLPWLFLLLAIRASLPLNVSPEISIAVTFGLLGCLGWAGPARVACMAVREFRAGDLMLQSRAMGMSPARVILRQLVPTLSPLLRAQFWIAVPLFILSEANLGALGLSVSEPLPSWGNLLAELQYLQGVSDQPVVLAPAILLCTTVCCILLLTRREVKNV